MPRQFQAQKERKLAEPWSRKSESLPPPDGANARRRELCTVIHSRLGVERAKVPCRPVFRSRRSATDKVQGAERAKARRGGECEKRKNRSWLAARKGTGRRESESVGISPALVAGRAKVRAQRKRKSAQLFTYHSLKERLIDTIQRRYPCLYPFIPKSKRNHRPTDNPPARQVEAARTPQ